MKQIVCLATSPWYPIPTRKQQVMSRMPDAEILYFDPSATIIAPLRDKSTKPLMRMPAKNTSRKKSRWEYEILFFKAISVPLSCDDVFAVRLYLFSQPGDVDVDGAVEHDDVVAPYLAQNVGAREDGLAMAQKKRENFKFGLGEFHLFPVDMAGLALKVQDQPLEGDRVVGFFPVGGYGRTAKHAFYPGYDFAYRERFGNVVVGSYFETYDRVVFGIFGGAEYDGYLCRVGPAFELPGQFESTCFAHHYVEQDKVVAGNLFFQCLFGVIGYIDRKPFYFEVELQYLAQRFFIVNDKYLRLFHWGESVSRTKIKIF